MITPAEIAVRRGTKAELQSIVLASGEPGFTLDTKELYLGTGSENILVSQPAPIIVSAARNSNYAVNSYLYGPDGVPMNISQFVAPFDLTLIGISASTDGDHTWNAEVHVSGTLVGSGYLEVNSASTGYRNDLDIDVDAGSPISVYCSGTGIKKPRVDAIFIRRYF